MTTATTARTGLPVWGRDRRQVFGRLGTLVLGMVLLVAAWAKAVHPVAFAEQITTLGLDRPLGAWATAILVIALEVGLGVALLLDLRRPLILVPASLLVVFFLILTGREWWLDARGLLPAGASCGCFGNLVERTPRQAFLQDLALLLPPLLAAWVGLRSPRGGGRGRLGLAAVLAGLAGIFAAWAPSLPLDDLATRLRPGMEAASVCSGSGDARVCLEDLIPELAGGHHWVILSELTNVDLTARLDGLNAAALRAGTGTVWVLSAATMEDVQDFQWNWGPAFEIRQASDSLLAPLVRRFPRSFEVRDGAITATYDGIPEALAGAPGEATGSPSGDAAAAAGEEGI